MIACDGTNVQRYDLPIINYYEEEISEQYYAQSFSQRYDNMNQTWMLYVSTSPEIDNPVIGSGAPGSDKALIYNFLENSWATYTFPVPFSCLGRFSAVSGETWATMTQQWDETDSQWNGFIQQKAAPILLGGDVNGNVYWMDNANAVTDNGTTILPYVTTTRWNPILSLGQRNQFAYIDIYYSIASTDPEDPIELTLSFFTDNSENVAIVKTLTLDGPENSEVTFKRVYVNLVGQFIQMNIDPSEDAFFKILGFILWVKPAGRLTPGRTV